MRPTAVAGAFYPGDKQKLEAMVRDFLDKAEVPALKGRVVAVMAPHAGYVYSGPVAAYSYKALQGKPIATAIVLGCSHAADFDGAALSPDDAWSCPLGPVAVDRQVNKGLLAATPIFRESREAHAGTVYRPEHNLEVQIPFIKAALPDAAIVPVLLSDMPAAECGEVAKALAPILKRAGTVLVVSSDMAHFPDDAGAKRSDTAMLEVIAALDPNRILQRDRELMRSGIRGLDCTLCGLKAVVTAVLAGSEVGVREAVILGHGTSADTAGDKSRCVGYGAVAFLAPEEAPRADADELPLTESEKRRLLEVARQTLEARYGLAKPPDLVPGGSVTLTAPTACFVTLKLKGRLRGCIGELEPRQPLIEAVADRAIAAAEQDPRFMPVTADELGRIAIEISAMSRLRKVDSPEEVIVGKHGVVVEQGFRKGVFLPQVAPEQGWDRDTMLTILCTEKAGLPGDAWKKGADLWVFTANVFSEEEFGMAPPDSLKSR